MIHGPPNNVRAVCLEFLKKLVHVFDQCVGEIRMIASLAGPQRVGTFAEHYLEIAERKKLLTGRREIAVEAQFVDEIGRRDGEILDGKDVSAVDQFSLWTHGRRL